MKAVFEDRWSLFSGFIHWCKVIYNMEGSDREQKNTTIINSVHKGSSQKFAHRGQTKELSYGTLPPPPVRKRKCDRQWEKCMADGFNCPDLFQRSSLTTDKGVHQTLVIDRRHQFPMKSSFFITTCSNNAVCLTHMQECFSGGSASIAKRTRWQSRTVEKYDFYSFFSFSACSKTDGRPIYTGVDLLGVELEWVPAPSTWPSNAQSKSSDQPLPHAWWCTFRLGDQATTLDTFFRE